MDRELWAQTMAGELRAERGRKKLTYAELVERTGMSKSSVIRYLDGERDIPMTALAKFCLALDLTPAEVAARVDARLNS